jgi:phosphoglycolate phosphatase
VLFDGVLPMLDALQARGHKLAVATGKSRRGLDEALPPSRCATVSTPPARRRDLRQAAPAHAARTDGRTGRPAERTLMIGDTTHDLQLAINAGCASVGVSYGAHRAGQLRRAGAAASWRTRCRSADGCSNA